MAATDSSLQSQSTTLRHRSRVSETDSTSNVDDSSHPCPEETVQNKLSQNGLEKSSSASVTSSGDDKGKSLLGYFMTELTKNYRLEADATEFAERRDRVYTSVHTPKNLEKFLAFGFLQCLDSILYMVTFLPLRILVALMNILTYPCSLIFWGRGKPMLDASQLCDLLKGLILILSCYITSQVDMSMIYHIVRGQSIMKFYVFFNMLDVMDKLVSQFGQDILDSLYWTAVEPRCRRREHFGTIFHLVFAIVYVVAHTMMILMQAIILNVAFNSHNKNLLTVMMSNNFVEIKVNVFKRVDKTNLCQITYSDVRERFHYLVLLFFVFVRNMKELNWNWDMALPLLQDAFIVFLVEVFVDWIKHAFITKLSELSASHYAEFSLGLAQDIASSQKKHAFTNFSDQVCRRMGFTPIPLICLLYMVCYSSFTLEGPLAWLIVALLYVCLISTKVLNGIILLGWAQRLLNERDKTAHTTGTVINSQTHPKKETGKGRDPRKTEPIIVGEDTIKLLESNTSVMSEAANTESSSPSQGNLAAQFSTIEDFTTLSSGSIRRDEIGSEHKNSKAVHTIQPSQVSLKEEQAEGISAHMPIFTPLSGNVVDVEKSSGHCDSTNVLVSPQPKCIHSHCQHESDPFIRFQQECLNAPKVFSQNSQCGNEVASSLYTAVPKQFVSTPNIAISPVVSYSEPAISQDVSYRVLSSQQVPSFHPRSASSLPPSFDTSPNMFAELENDQSLFIPSTTAQADVMIPPASIRSPKRKHSQTSITSAESFSMEGSESIPHAVGLIDSPCLNPLCSDSATDSVEGHSQETGEQPISAAIPVSEAADSSPTDTMAESGPSSSSLKPSQDGSSNETFDVTAVQHL